MYLLGNCWGTCSDVYGVTPIMEMGLKKAAMVEEPHFWPGQDWDWQSLMVLLLLMAMECMAVNNSCDRTVPGLD